MAVSTIVETAWVISLGASLHVDIDSSEISGSKESNVGHRGCEEERVSIVSEENLIDDHMSTGNDQRNAKASKKPSLISFMSRSVNPFEEADREAEHSNQQDGD